MDELKAVYEKAFTGIGPSDHMRERVRALGSSRTARPPFVRRLYVVMAAVCLLAYAVMKGYSFFTGGNHVGPDVPKGNPGDLFSGGLILPLNICVGIIVACTMYTFYTLFLEGEEER